MIELISAHQGGQGRGSRVTSGANYQPIASSSCDDEEGHADDDDSPCHEVEGEEDEEQQHEEASSSPSNNAADRLTEGEIRDLEYTTRSANTFLINFLLLSFLIALSVSLGSSSSLNFIFPSSSSSSSSSSTSSSSSGVSKTPNGVYYLHKCTGDTHNCNHHIHLSPNHQNKNSHGHISHLHSHTRPRVPQHYNPSHSKNNFHSHTTVTHPDPSGTDRGNALNMNNQENLEHQQPHVTVKEFSCIPTRPPHAKEDALMEIPNSRMHLRYASSHVLPHLDTDDGLYLSGSGSVVAVTDSMNVATTVARNGNARHLRGGVYLYKWGCSNSSNNDTHHHDSRWHRVGRTLWGDDDAEEDIQNINNNNENNNNHANSHKNRYHSKFHHNKHSSKAEKEFGGLHVSLSDSGTTVLISTEHTIKCFDWDDEVHDWVIRRKSPTKSPYDDSDGNILFMPVFASSSPLSRQQFQTEGSLSRRTNLLTNLSQDGKTLVISVVVGNAEPIQLNQVLLYPGEQRSDKLYQRLSRQTTVLQWDETTREWIVVGTPFMLDSFADLPQLNVASTNEGLVVTYSDWAMGIEQYRYNQEEDSTNSNEWPRVKLYRPWGEPAYNHTSAVVRFQNDFFLRASILSHYQYTLQTSRNGNTWVESFSELHRQSVDLKWNQFQSRNTTTGVNLSNHSSSSYNCLVSEDLKSSSGGSFQFRKLSPDGSTLLLIQYSTLRILQRRGDNSLLDVQSECTIHDTRDVLILDYHHIAFSNNGSLLAYVDLNSNMHLYSVP